MTVHSGPLPSPSAVDLRPGEHAPLPSHAQARMVARTAFALLLTVLAVWVAQDFLAPLAWAAVIAITAWPLYARVAAVAGGSSRTMPALIFTVLTGLVLVVPVMLAVQQVAQSVVALVQWAVDVASHGLPVPGWVTQVPFAGDYIARWWQANLADPQAATQWLGGINVESVTARARTLGGELLHRLFLFAIMLVGLFFMLRDGAWLADRLADTADRLLGGAGERLAGKMIDAVRGTVNGTVGVAIVEGLIIGIGYYVGGVPNPALFTLLTIAFAMLPMGAEIAVAAATLMLLLQGGGLLPAVGVFAFGMAVTVVGDNVFWPALVGRTARLPFLVTLIGVLGGVQVFGLIGLFLGPVIMTAFLTVWREWVLVEERPADAQPEPPDR